MIYLSYLVLRLYAIAHNKADLSATSFDVLALSSIILLPRLVGTILKRNVVILGIQSMFFDFGSFMLFASISCGGFFLSLRMFFAPQAPVFAYLYGGSHFKRQEPLRGTHFLAHAENLVRERLSRF